MALKRALAKQDWPSMDDYARAKTEPGRNEKADEVPRGWLDFALQYNLKSEAPVFSRPFGTYTNTGFEPGVETPGYFRLSLRDTIP
ncbi:MAG TPA: hypothetical protein VGY56_13080 [Verrucomicrobiae bacterium]|nr:hypothetical protein [Verrucomicrobiae bacterium]